MLLSNIMFLSNSIKQKITKQKFIKQITKQNVKLTNKLTDKLTDKLTEIKKLLCKTKFNKTYYHFFVYLIDILELIEKKYVLYIDNNYNIKSYPNINWEIIIIDNEIGFKHEDKYTVIYTKNVIYNFNINNYLKYPIYFVKTSSGDRLGNMMFAYNFFIQAVYQQHVNPESGYIIQNKCNNLRYYKKYYQINLIYLQIQTLFSLTCTAKLLNYNKTIIFNIDSSITNLNNLKLTWNNIHDSIKCSHYNTDLINKNNDNIFEQGVIHFRGSDFGITNENARIIQQNSNNLGFYVLHFNYYVRQIRNINLDFLPKQFYIFSDPDDYNMINILILYLNYYFPNIEFLQESMFWNVIGHTVTDSLCVINAMSKFKILIVSNSTFALHAALLSNAKIILGPFNNNSNVIPYCYLKCFAELNTLLSNENKCLNNNNLNYTLFENIHFQYNNQKFYISHREIFYLICKILDISYREIQKLENLDSDYLLNNKNQNYLKLLDLKFLLSLISYFKDNSKLFTFFTCLHNLIQNRDIDFVIKLIDSLIV